MKYKAVIFDLFGTLVDNFSTIEYFKVLDDMSAALGAPADDFSKLWRDTFEMRCNGTHETEKDSIRYICEQLGIRVTKAQVNQASAIRLEYTVKTIVPRPNTIATIKELKETGYKVGLISDCSPEAPAVWPKTLFAGVFDCTIFSCEVGVKKPDRRIYQMACDKLGVKPGDCLYVGDGASHELSGALKAFMHPVQIIDPKENVDTHYVDREENWKGPQIAYIGEVLDIVRNS